MEVGGEYSSLRVLIIGGGPVSLRADCRMLGCKVVVVEKRTRITRNNVLHLWPFTIEHLKQLGAKSFTGNFVLEQLITSVSVCNVMCNMMYDRVMVTQCMGCDDTVVGDDVII